MNGIQKTAIVASIIIVVGIIGTYNDIQYFQKWDKMDKMVAALSAHFMIIQTAEAKVISTPHSPAPATPLSPMTVITSPTQAHEDTSKYFYSPQQVQELQKQGALQTNMHYRNQDQAVYNTFKGIVDQYAKAFGTYPQSWDGVKNTISTVLNTTFPLGDSIMYPQSLEDDTTTPSSYTGTYQVQNIVSDSSQEQQYTDISEPYTFNETEYHKFFDEMFSKANAINDTSNNDTKSNATLNAEEDEDEASEQEARAGGYYEDENEDDNDGPYYEAVDHGTSDPLNNANATTANAITNTNNDTINTHANNTVAYGFNQTELEKYYESLPNPTPGKIVDLHLGNTTVTSNTTDANRTN